MNILNPATIIYNGDGYEVAILEGGDTSSQPGLLMMGDDSGSARGISVDYNGRIGLSSDSIGALSALNSSSAILAAGATFTGTAEINTFASVLVSLKTDQDGILYTEFSTDGINWDSSIPFVVSANTNEIHRLVKGTRYFRIRFTNTSASPQSFFRLSTSYGDFPQLTSALNSSVASDADAIVTRTIDSEISIATQKFADYYKINKFGRNPDIDTATVPEDVWNPGGLYSGFPTGAPENLVVFSDSGSDTGILTFTYLATSDSTDFQTANVTLNGTTPVNSGISVYRVIRASYNSGNSTTANVGSITGRHQTTTANVFFSLVPGFANTTLGIMTVPASTTGYLRRLVVTVGQKTAGTITGVIWIREFGKGPRLIRPFSASASAIYTDEPYGGLMLPAKSDIVIRVTFASTNNLDVSSLFDIVFVKD